MGHILVGGGRSTAVILGNFAVPGATLPGLGTTEANAATPIRAAGTVLLPAASVDANGTGRSMALRKNSGNSGAVINFTDSTQQIVYGAGSDHFAVGDTIDLQYNGAGTAFTPYFFKYSFAADAGHAAHYFGITTTMPSGTNFQSFSCSNTNGTESNARATMRCAGTFSNLCVHVSTSTSTTTTWTSRKNTANGAQTVSVTGGTTGVFEDTTHSDTFASGDLVDWSFSGGSGSGVACASGLLKFNALDAELTGGGGSTAFSASDQFFSAVGVFAGIATESLVKIQHGFAAKARNFRTLIIGNTMTGSTTFFVRKNGADATQTISVGAAATGLFEDTTHTDQFSATDDVDYVQRGGTSGSINTSHFYQTETYLPPTVTQPLEINQARVRAAFW
jgi:hypothetical protein